MDATNRRRTIIVGNLQRRLLLNYAMHLIMIVGLFLAALYVPPMLNMQNPEFASSARAVVAKELLAMHVRMWPALLFVVVAISIHAVIVTHRVAGPMVQIRHALDRLRAGDLEHRIHIRSNDYMKVETDHINAMLDVFAQHLEDARRDSRVVSVPPSNRDDSIVGV